MLSITSRCLTLAFAFPGESKNSDETRPGKVNPTQTLTLKADTRYWGLKTSKLNLQRLISIIIIRFIACYIMLLLLVHFKKEGRTLS